MRCFREWSNTSRSATGSAAFALLLAVFAIVRCIQNALNSAMKHCMATLSSRGMNGGYRVNTAAGLCDYNIKRLGMPEMLKKIELQLNTEAKL